MAEIEDDGSLAFLNIPRDENNKSFNCPQVSQSQLINTTFWVADYLEDIPTKFSKSKGKAGQTLVKIKPTKDAPDSQCQKFFTGSTDILYTLQCVRKLKAFPRRCTLRGNGNRYWLE